MFRHSASGLLSNKVMLKSPQISSNWENTLPKTNMTGWTICMFNRKYIFKWRIFHCRVFFFGGVHYILQNTMLLVCSKQKFIFHSQGAITAWQWPKKKIQPNKCHCFGTRLNIPIIRTIKANHEFSLQYLLLSDIELPMSSWRYQPLVSRLRPCPFISMGSSTWGPGWPGWFYRFFIFQNMGKRWVLGI